MKIVGLTGGIGSGKTVASKVFETLGCTIYNSDIRAKELYFDKNIKTIIEQKFGNQFYANSNTLNKEWISENIINNNNLREVLNSIIHPGVINDFNQFIKKHSNTKLIIKESALLIEANAHKNLDALIIVIAPKKLRIERVKQRSNMSDLQIEKIINAQMLDEMKIKFCTHQIINDNDTALLPQVLKLYQLISN